jgi:hypothetical protein
LFVSHLFKENFPDHSFPAVEVSLLQHLHLPYPDLLFLSSFLFCKTITLRVHNNMTMLVGHFFLLKGKPPQVTIGFLLILSTYNSN